MAIELSPTWTSFEWPGPDGVAPAEASLPDEVVAVFTWDDATRRWLGYFPGLEHVPGLNTLTMFASGATYWVAAVEAVAWTIETPHLGGFERLAAGQPGETLVATATAP